MSSGTVEFQESRLSTLTIARSSFLKYVQAYADQYNLNHFLPACVNVFSVRGDATFSNHSCDYAGAVYNEGKMR